MLHVRGNLLNQVIPVATGVNLECCDRVTGLQEKSRGPEFLR